MKRFIILIISVMLTGCVTPANKVADIAPNKISSNKVTEIVDAPKEPMPRIELRGHSGLIGRLSLDRAGRWLVSSYSDGTIRVWDALTGRLERTIRPPIGQNGSGVSRVAISPDGNLVAGGGVTQFTDNTAAGDKKRQGSGQRA